MAGLFNKVPTDLDINGPILSITTEPTGVTGIGTTVGATGGASVSITGVATAVVGSSGTGGSGYLSYQWYEEGVGALSNGTYITGTASTGAVGSTATLTLSNLVTPTDNDRKFYLEVDYVPSYTVGVQSVTVPGVRTGNAWNEPITSGVATVTVTPLIDIIAQPSNTQTLINSTPDQHLANATAHITVNADLSDSTFSDDLTYQWYLDGEEVIDEVKTTTTTTGSNVSGTVENYYTTPGSHTFPSVSIEDVEITVAGASGGNGGRDGGGPGGIASGGTVGKFSLPNAGFLGKQINFFVGQSGNDGTSGSTPNTQGEGGSLPNSPGGVGDGGRGGAAGPRGWSGGGGGGGAATYLENDSTGINFIVSGGGGGGGGGSHNVRGRDGGTSHSEFINETGPINVSDGGAGKNKSGDGGGGGGGGGGAPGFNGGNAGQDNGTPSAGGEGGGSRYQPQNSTLQDEWRGPAGEGANGYVNLKYTGFTDTTVTTVTNTTISGSTKSTLRLSCDTVGVQTAQCKITSATASNSPIYTDTVNVVFNSTAVDNNINVEGIGIGITASLATLNLANGDFTLQTERGDVSTGQINNEWVLYSPDKDMDVEMDLYGGKGKDFAATSIYAAASGGEGGYSRIRFTMKQNEEYVIAGLTTSINTPFVYRKGTLIACVGGGGDAGAASKGGDGGGMNVNGQGTQGPYGNGGMGANSGFVSMNGIFGTAAGRPPLVYPQDTWAGVGVLGVLSGVPGTTISCTKGVYWAQQGIAPCDDIGTGQFRLSGGESVTNTTTAITRGYKSGYNIIQTAGAARALGATSGKGGNGMTGGEGGDRTGGAGGSGLRNDGSVTLVDTRLGGSTEDAKVVLRLQS